MSRDADDMYHTCRWCKHFEKGRCYRGFASSVISVNHAIYAVAEEGELSGVIEETLNSSFPKELLRGIINLLVKWKISKKRIKELENYYNEKLPEILDFKLKEKLDENVSMLYQDRLENKIIEVETGLDINDPENFYCKEFW